MPATALMWVVRGSFGVGPHSWGGVLRRPRKDNENLFRASSTFREVFGALARRGGSEDRCGKRAR